MSTIAKVTVSLKDVKPPVRRRLEVPFDLRLDRLHQVLQAAFGWTDSHLWEIYARGFGWGIPDADWDDGPFDARKTTLGGLLEDTRVKTLTYLYDFGDGWEHKIKITAITEAEPDARYPRLVHATGCCPPEDIGGPVGYGEFLEAISDPKHKAHAHWTEWGPENFDPKDTGFDDLRDDVEFLAKRWQPKRKRQRK